MHIDPQRYHGRPAETRQPREEAAYALLERAGVPFDRMDHSETATIEDCHAVEQYLDTTVCKNLFLCNRQKTKFYLLILPGDKVFHTKDLSAQIGSARLSFAPGEKMEELIGTTPGSASVLSLVFDHDHQVQLLINREVLDAEYFACHPCINTSSLQFLTRDLVDKVLPALGVTPTYVTL